MVVALEQISIMEKQIETAEEGTAELQKQVDLLKTTVKTMQDLIEVYKTKELMQAKLDETKDKLHEKELKASQPSMWENLQKYFTGGGVGALVVLAAFLL